MNELYSVDGQIYEVSPENKDKFLNDFPNAELYKEQSDDQVKNTEQDQQGLEQPDFATDMLDPEDKILDDRAKETQAARDLMSSLNIPVMEAPKKQATIEPLSETEFYTGRMSKAELDKKAEQEARQKRIDTGQEQLSASESILNTLGNALNQLETVDDRAKYLYYFAGTFDFDTEEGKQRSEENRKKLLEIEGDLRKLDQEALKANIKKGGRFQIEKKTGGPLKPPPNPGAAALPKKVRNKMGFFKKGGSITKRKAGGRIVKRAIGGGVALRGHGAVRKV